jgi:quinol monooxygenase YgiN
MRGCMVVGTLRIPLSPGRRTEVLEILRSIQGPVLAQPGCAACHIYEEESPEQAVILIERWDSEAALQEHIRSDAYRRILGAIELSTCPPEVCFDYVSSSEGMELIERLRNLGGTDASPGLLQPKRKRPRDESHHH